MSQSSSSPFGLQEAPAVSANDVPNENRVPSSLGDPSSSSASTAPRGSHLRSVSNDDEAALLCTPSRKRVNEDPDELERSASRSLKRSHALLSATYRQSAINLSTPVSLPECWLGRLGCSSLSLSFFMETFSFPLFFSVCFVRSWLPLHRLDLRSPHLRIMSWMLPHLLRVCLLQSTLRLRMILL